MTEWSPEHHRRRVRMSVIGGDQCGSSTGRDEGDREHWDDQKLTTMPRSWSARSQEVGQRRSSMSSHRNAELTGADWGLP
jgi:hypothetical protein